MVLLSKEDKEIWKKYTLNMDKLRINIEKLEVKPGNHNLNKENKKKINDNTFDKFLRLLNNLVILIGNQSQVFLVLYS